MAEQAAAGNERRRSRRQRSVLLACFSAAPASCRKEQLQLQPHQENDNIDTDTEEMRRRRRRISSRSSTAVDEKPLRKIADAFKDLANIVVNSDQSSSSPDHVIEVAAFSRACSFVAPLFGSVGFHFKFIEMDYVTKVLTN